jgi:hypothetical protein
MARCPQTLVLARELILAPEFASIEEWLRFIARDFPRVHAPCMNAW